MLRITSAFIGVFLLWLIGLSCEDRPETNDLGVGNKIPKSQDVSTTGDAAVAKGVNLAQLKGWNIVVADNAIPSEIYAAEEFQEFFHQASGLKLPIVHKIKRWDKHVFIGPGMVMRASPVGFSVEDLGPEDLHIVVRDESIAIAGGRPRGTLYGVYTFLEDYLGVRFLTHDHTHVPAVGRQRLIGPLDRVYRPPFVNYRHAAYKAPHRYPVFAVRNRNNAIHGVGIFDPVAPDRNLARFGGLSPFLLINHSFYGQVPYDKYGQDHPEYFGLWDGKRMNDFMHTHLCLTNPDLISIVTNAVLKEIQRPNCVGRKNFSVAQNDTQWQYCQCAKCAAIDATEESHMGALLKFVNAVAGEVAKTHPDVYIGTLAYGFSRKPPKTIKCRPNVEINLTTVGRCHLHLITDPNCPPNVQFLGELKGWNRICQNLYFWDYHFGAGRNLLPYPDLFMMKPNINTLVAHGVKGVFMQSNYEVAATELSDLRHYLMSRLLWNPKLNDREIVNEFLDLHYSEAAPLIRRFIDLVHNHYKDIKTHHIKWAAHGLPVDESVATAGLKLFAEAMQLAQSDKVRTRVEKASICAHRAAIDPICRLKKDAAIDPSLAERMRPLIKEFFRLCDKHGLAGYVASDRQRIEGILANQGLPKPALKLPLLPISKEWRFTTDPENQGEAQRYFEVDFDDSRWTVLKDYDFWPGEYTGVGWFRQTINPPADVADQKHLYLFFGAVDEEAFVYINGEYAFERSAKSTGQTPQVLWNQPFLYDVKGLIRPGEPNVIAVRVHNTALAGGIWQPVYLFPTDEEWTAQEIFDEL